MVIFGVWPVRVNQLGESDGEVHCVGLPVMGSAAVPRVYLLWPGASGGKRRSGFVVDNAILGSGERLG